MAVKSAQVTVGFTATLLSSTEPGDRNAAPDGQSVAVSNPTGGVSVFLGGPDVTTANGYLLGAGEKTSVDLLGGEALYGIVGSGSQLTYVLRSGA